MVAANFSLTWISAKAMLLSQCVQASLCHGAIRVAEVLTRAGAKRLGEQRWSTLFGQFGGLIKLFPGVGHAAILLLAVAGASPGNGVGSVILYASSDARPPNPECGRLA